MPWLCFKMKSEATSKSILRAILLLITVCQCITKQPPNSNKFVTDITLVPPSKSHHDDRLCPLEFSAITQDSSFLELQTRVEKKKEGPKIEVQKEFRLSCRCGKDVVPFSNLLLPFDIPFGKCAASKVKVELMSGGTEERTNRWGYNYKVPWGMKAHQIERAMGNPMNQKWAKASEHHFSDFVGRTDAEVIGVPGGDIAEFINGLNSFMEMTNEPIEQEDCKLLLRGFLKEYSKASFYMPTDLAAVDGIEAELDMSGLDLSATPADDLKEPLLNLLTSSLYQASLTLRVMLQNPQNYRLRQISGGGKLAACAIRGFYELLWDKNDPISNKMRLVELDGPSEEIAIVRVFASLPCEAQGILPLIAPMSDKVCDNDDCNRQVYIIHPQAPIVMHEELSDFLAEQDARVQAAEMRRILKANSMRYEDLAIAAVRHPTDKIRMPQFNVHFE